MNYKDPWAARGWTTGCQQVVIRSCTDDPKMSTVHPQAVGEFSTGCPRAGDTSGDAKGRPKVWMRPTGRPKIVFAERLPSFKPRRSKTGSGPSEVRIRSVGGQDRILRGWLELRLMGRRGPPDGRLDGTKGLWCHRFRHLRTSPGRRQDVARTSPGRLQDGARASSGRRQGGGRDCHKWLAAVLRVAI